MGTKTMYETIMSLPLFKGTSHEQISAFLSCTRLDFHKYSPGEPIVEAGTLTTHLIFIISGCATMQRILPAAGVTLDIMMKEGCVIGASTLYGMHTEQPANIVAATQVSTMRIPKDQYQQLLSTDDIYLVNYLNYLSYKEQYYAEIIDRLPAGSVGDRLAMICTRFAERNMSVLNIKIDCTRLCSKFNISEDELMNELESAGFSPEIIKLL